MAAQMILGLSIMVGLHEMGHMLAAKAFGMRVEQFSIGFPPRIFKVKYGETEYSIGAIPLGGYVKISGMIDESLDLSKMAEEPKEYEFRAKPAWQRLIVMMGGILVNVMTGIVIFVIMIYSFGETYLPREEVNKYGLVAHELAQEIGLQTGDKILRINGKDYRDYLDITSPDKLLETNAYYTVDRNGQILDIPIPGNFLETLSTSGRDNDLSFIEPIKKFTIDRIEKNSGAEAAGLESGDRIISINGQVVQFFHEVTDLLKKIPGEMAKLEIQRQEQILTMDVQVSDKGTLGFYANHDLKVDTIHYTFLESIPKGTKEAFGIVFINIKAFGKIFSGDLDFSKSISGPIGIAKTFGGNWDWFRFWRLIGLLSMILAFMNFLPIPALDGGHVMFLTFEIVSGHKPSDKFMEMAQKVGMVLLLSLMVFVIFNDIFKEIF